MPSVTLLFTDYRSCLHLAHFIDKCFPRTTEVHRPSQPGMCSAAPTGPWQPSVSTCRSSAASPATMGLLYHCWADQSDYTKHSKQQSEFLPNNPLQNTAMGVCPTQRTCLGTSALLETPRTHCHNNHVRFLLPSDR